MKMSVLDLCMVISAGSNVIVDATDMSTLDMRSIASNAKMSGTHVTIRNASLLSLLDCRTIAMAGGKGTVTFDFT